MYLTWIPPDDVCGLSMQFRFQQVTAPYQDHKEIIRGLRASSGNHDAQYASAPRHQSKVTLLNSRPSEYRYLSTRFPPFNEHNQDRDGLSELATGVPFMVVSYS